jgi:hypothetical protein
VDQRGQLLIADYAGSIFRLIRTIKQTRPQDLDATQRHRFVPSTKAHQMQPGVIPYSVNAPGWADGATAERFIALTGDTRIGYTSAGGWNFANGAVLVQTLSLEREAGNPASRHRIETRLLARQGGQWTVPSVNDNNPTLVRKLAGEGIAIRDQRASGGIHAGLYFRAGPNAVPSRSRRNFVPG